MALVIVIDFILGLMLGMVGMVLRLLPTTAKLYRRLVFVFRLVRGHTRDESSHVLGCVGSGSSHPPSRNHSISKSLFEKL